MELFVIFVIILAIYGAGWIWQTLNDVFRDINRTNWDNRVYGQVASARDVRKMLGGVDLGRLRQAYGRFAELHDGQTHVHQLFESPKVSFYYNGSRALLSIYQTSDAPPQLYSQLTFTAPPGWFHRLEIFPQRFQDNDVKYLNVSDIQIGDADFDPRYVVKSDAEPFAREYLDARVRKSIDDLRGLLGNDRILISLNSSRLMIRKHAVISEVQDLAAFADISGVLYDRVAGLSRKEDGIEILDDDVPAPAAADPICQVCGAPVDAVARVYCRRCKTPHCKDCWEFNGKCSTYACGEERYSTKY